MRKIWIGLGCWSTLGFSLWAQALWGQNRSDDLFAQQQPLGKGETKGQETKGQVGKGPADKEPLPFAEPKQLEPQLPNPKPLGKMDLRPLDDPPSPARPSPPIRGTATVEADSPLRLSEVLISIEQHYPLLRAAEEERAIVGGRLTSAMGAFDTMLKASSTNIPNGTYENYRFNVGVDQAFPTTGVTAFTNYRGGYGDFPIYSGSGKTAEGGEFRGGLNIPLLRDNAIDRRRANLQQATINRAAVEPLLDRQRLDFQRAAARVYWSWVAAGERVRITRTLLQLANDRDKQLKELVGDKLVARIDRIDNQQNIAARNAVLVESQLRFTQAAIDLSLYLRDSAGQTLIPGESRLPAFPELVAPDASQFDDALKMAFEQRPELRRLRYQREIAQVELQLAMNQTLPAVNAFIAGASDTGRGKPTSGPSRLDRNSLEVGMEFQLPYQRREPLGRTETARGQIRQIAQQERFAQDSIRSEVQNTFATVERAYELHQQAQKRVGLARQVAEAERQRLKDGDSDVLRVTLREQAAFEAEIIEVNAMFEYFRSLAEYRAAFRVTSIPAN